MRKRVFGGHTVAQLSDLRRNPADGGAFYLALQEAATDLFALAEEHEKLADAVQKLIAAAKTAARESRSSSLPTGLKPALEKLSEALDDPALKKFTSP